MTPDRPTIYVPAWYANESGLLLPSSVAPLLPTPSPALPAGVGGPINPVAISRRQPPTGLDQVGVYFAESEADRPTSTWQDVESHLAQVPFEPAMAAASRIAALTWAARMDNDSQLRLARAVFGEGPILIKMQAFLARESHAVLLVEQHALVLLRLIMEHARDGALDEGLTADEVEHLQNALLGATSLADLLAQQMENQDWLREPDQAVAFFVQNAAYNGKPAPLGEIARSRTLHTELANSPELMASEHFCPIDEWMAADYQFTTEEQLAFGFSLSAMTSSWNRDNTAGSATVVTPERVSELFKRMSWEGREAEALALLSADRDWYRQAFAASGDSLEHVAWELRPLMQRPFVQLANGGLLLTSPRTLAGWITDGFHYRLLDAAQRRNTTRQGKTSRKYTAFAGALLEQHCFRLARDAFQISRAGSVFPEQRYGPKGGAKTSDVAILIGTDLVLVEVTASRLRADTLLLRAPEKVRADLERLVTAKAKQLDGCIKALAKGTARIPADDPEVVWPAIERVWPLIVAGGNVAQNEYVWSWIRTETATLFASPKVQPLTLLDVEDFEVLMGLAEHGVSLIGLLQHKTSPRYSDLELAISLRDNPTVPGAGLPRASSVEQAFADAMNAAQEYFGDQSAEPSSADVYPPLAR